MFQALSVGTALAIQGYPEGTGSQSAIPNGRTWDITVLAGISELPSGDNGKSEPAWMRNVDHLMR